MASQSTSSDPAAARCLLASAAIKLASTAKAVPSTNPSAVLRRTTVSNKLSQQIAIAEAAMPVLGEGRVVRHPPWPRHDGPDTVTAHQSLDATAAHPAALGPQLGMDARAFGWSSLTAPWGFPCCVRFPCVH